MPWIQTYTGKSFNIYYPTADMVCIEDIAHALSLQCRFTGHCLDFYSVAQHSVLASYQAPTPDVLTALLHDCAEAYLGDVASPLKRGGAWAGYRHLEDNLLSFLASILGFTYPFSPAVHTVDMRMLATERRDVMRWVPQSWGVVDDYVPFRETIRPWCCEESKSRFLARYYELTAG
jgi:hypothetical protein